MARDVLRRIRSRIDGQGWARNAGPASVDPVVQERDSPDSFAVLLHLSHEIRTPLNSMLALSQLLRDGLAGPLNAEQQKYVEIIERNGQNLIRLVGDVLDLSRMELGRVDLDLRSLDLGDQLHSAAAALAPLAEAKRIAMVVETPELPPVRCDPDRVRQVLTNLIGNAIKFTDEGSVTLRAEPGPGVVFVHVCDTGVGIPEEARARIFEEFFQVGQGRGDRRGTRRGTGLGLGLAITRRLVRLMGGALFVESTEGAGSRFTFTLPVADPDSHLARPMEEEPGQVRAAAIVGSERVEGGAHQAHRFEDEPHGTNTAGR